MFDQSDNDDLGDEALWLEVSGYPRFKVPGGPVFPEGTPEYDAYRNVLRDELAKWVAGEPPYDKFDPFGA